MTVASVPFSYAAARDPSSVLRGKSTVGHRGGRTDHYWTLSGPDGVLAFCAIRLASHDHGHDGAERWFAWGIDGHILADRCAEGDPDHEHAGSPDCGLLGGAPCCVVTGIGAAELLAAWLKDEDDGVVWRKLEELYEPLVAAHARSAA